MKDLFDFANPISHADDPETSAEAGSQQTARGSRSEGCRVVLALVKLYPGSTACELWELATVDHARVLHEMQRVRQRLVDLENAGLVTKGPPRKCEVRKTSQRTWYATGGR